MCFACLDQVLGPHYSKLKYIYQSHRSRLIHNIPTHKQKSEGRNGTAVNYQPSVTTSNSHFNVILWKIYCRKSNYQRGFTIWLLVTFPLELCGHAIFPLDSARICNTASKTSVCIPCMIQNSCFAFNEFNSNKDLGTDLSVQIIYYHWNWKTFLHHLLLFCWYTCCRYYRYIAAT